MSKAIARRGDLMSVVVLVGCKGGVLLEAFVRPTAKKESKQIGRVRVRKSFSRCGYGRRPRVDYENGEDMYCINRR